MFHRSCFNQQTTIILMGQHSLEGQELLATKNHSNGNFTISQIRQRFTTERTLRNGVTVILRPIECTDQDQFRTFFRSLSPASVHFRFLEIIKELPNETVEKFCDLDYNKEIAIVAQPKSEDKIVAVARLIVDRRRESGEFALVVADAWQRLKLGTELLSYITEIAQEYGLVELHCYVSSDNPRMIRLAEKAGLRVKSFEGDVLEMAMRLDIPSFAPMA